MLDFNFTCVDIGAPTPETSTYTVLFEPANPVVGEVVHMTISGTGGRVSVDGPIETHPDSVGVEWDFDDPTTTFIDDQSYLPVKKRRNPTPNTGYGHITSHRWETAGTKTVTITSWEFGVGIQQQTFTVTVADHSSLSVTKDNYIDLTGSTTDMPAEDGVVTHITSYAQLIALSGTYGVNDVVIWRFRAGTTHLLDITAGGALISLSGDMHIIKSFGAGSRPLVQENANAYYENSLFVPVASNMRLIFHGVDFDGQYDHTQGVFVGSRLSVVQTSQSDISISMADLLAKRLDILLRGSGSSGADNNYGAVGCVVIENQDFGFYMAWSRFASIRGCVCRSPIISNRGDGKGATSSDFPDHCFIRVDGYKWCGISDCYINPNGGWSGFGGDRYLQGLARVHGHSNDLIGSCYASVIKNTGQGGNLVGIGEHSPNPTSDHAFANYSLVALNDFTMTLAGGSGVIISRGAGGVYAYGNVVYFANGGASQADANLVLFEMTDQRATSDAIWRVENRIRYNTVVSDRPTTIDGGIFWGAEKGDVLESTIDTANGAIIVTEHNLISGDSYANSASLISSTAFARGDSFRPITGGAAVSLVATSPPPFDFDMTRNAAGAVSANEGAHNAAGPDVGVISPAWGSTPVIGFLAAYGGDSVIGLTDVSGLTGDDWIVLELNWLINGVLEDSSTGDRRWNASTLFTQSETIDNVGTVQGYSSGDTVQARVFAMNRSGARVSALSNTITLP